MATYKLLQKSVDCSIGFLKPAELNRIKITRLTGLRRMSTISHSDVVKHEIVNNKGILTLNRPNKLNCINERITEILLRKLIEWENIVEMVIIKGEGKAFCAGGDIVSMTKYRGRNAHVTKTWFKKHYTLNGLIGQYPLPYVGLMDGITMGAGIVLASKTRIVTERTITSTPESKIGFFIDNGLGHVLSRLPHELGQYLGLTGHQLKGKDIVKCGIATHYTKSENIPTILKGLIEMKEPKKNLSEFLRTHTENLSNVEFSLKPNLELIESAFSAPSVEETIRKLQNDGSDFAQQTLNQLRRMSPISLKISKKLIDIHKNMTLQEGLIYDNRIALGALYGTSSLDFFEGVRALIIDKDNNPRWNPPTLEEVTDEMVERLFKEVPVEEELDVTNSVNELRKKLRS